MWYEKFLCLLLGLKVGDLGTKKILPTQPKINLLINPDNQKQLSKHKGHDE